VADSDATGHPEERFAWERRARKLLQTVVEATNQSLDHRLALQMVTDQVCIQMGWPVGHVVVRVGDSPEVLADAGLWYVENPGRFATFQSVTAGMRFAPGVGLPGRVLELGRPLWVTDVTADANFPRAQLAGDIAVRAAFAFPVLVNGSVYAVLEFFSDHPIDLDEPLLDVMQIIGVQLGSFARWPRPPPTRSLRPTVTETSSTGTGSRCRCSATRPTR
jgi:GAF domain-containing protein